MINIFKKGVKEIKEDNQELLEANGYIQKLKDLTENLKEKDEKIYSIQEDYKKIFNFFADIIVIIDAEGYILDLNRKAQMTFSNFFNDNIIGSNWKYILETLNKSCWDKTIEKELLEDKNYAEKSKEIYISRLNKHFLITVLPVIRYGELQYFIFTAKDITDIKNREIELLKKQKLLTAVSTITDIFTANYNINYLMEKIVETLGRVENVEMCYIYKNCLDEKGKIFAEKQKEWVSSNFNKDTRTLDKFYYSNTFPRWLEYFKLNHIVCGNIRTFPINEIQVLKTEKIKSICVVPIYANLQLWGFMGFDSCFKERNWSYDEESLLKVAANVIGGGIYQWSLRNNKKEVIEKSCINF